MVTIATTTAPESREDALMRLATQAKASGVKLYMDKVDGRFYASSRSQPGALHRLTGFSCTCQGFIRHGRCGHLAALHSALGWINVDPDPAGAVLPDCAVCHDAGVIDGPHSRWVGPARTGFRDTWTTAIPCPVCAGEVAA
jgi:hypothetical protein